jgi:hypothetical protein
MNTVIDKMVEGSDRYEIVSHAKSNCDCGYRTVTVPNGVAVRGYGKYNWKVIRIHNPKN